MIQYIIAAGFGLWLGSQSKKSKKSYAHGGEVDYDEIIQSISEIRYDKLPPIKERTMSDKAYNKILNNATKDAIRTLYTIYNVDIYDLQKATKQKGGSYYKAFVDLYGENLKYAHGGEIEYDNDENEAVGNFLLTTKDGKEILKKSKNSSQLEKAVVDYHSKKGIPNWEFEDDEDEGIDWVTFGDLYDSIKDHYAKGGMTEHGLEIGDKIISEKDNSVLVWGQDEKGKIKKNASIVNLDKGTRKNFAKGGKMQGYDDRLDESLSMRDGAGRKKQQSKKDRRDESAGMEKSMGRRKYASVGTMDKVKTLPKPAKDFIAYVTDMAGDTTLKYSKTFQGANRMMQNMLKKNQDVSTHGVSKYDPFYGTWIGKMFFEPIKGFAKGGQMQGYNARGDEELGMTDGKESRFQQSKKDRRDEMKGENRSAGNKTYGSFEKGGETDFIQQVVDSPDFRKGAFTKKAKSRDLTTQEFMKKVLKNPDKYDERTRKQAQFMKNITS